MLIEKLMLRVARRCCAPLVRQRCDDWLLAATGLQRWERRAASSG